MSRVSFHCDWHDAFQIVGLAFGIGGVGLIITGAIESEKLLLPGVICIVIGCFIIMGSCIDRRYAKPRRKSPPLTPVPVVQLEPSTAIVPRLQPLTRQDTPRILSTNRQKVVVYTVKKPAQPQILEV